MGWTDVFPVFTEEMVDDFEAQVTPDERAELETWYGTERVLNAQPDKPDIVSVSLFWKNVREGDPELPTPTREILQNAQELGFAKRYCPWDHYVKPLLELAPELMAKFPDAVVRVYLARDMEFLAEELAEVGNEVHVMKSSSIHFAPAGLWRFLPFSESGKRVTVTDIDRLNELESDLLRSKTMEQAGLGAWRVPVPIDLTDDRRISYLPFMGCQFGVQGGQLDARQLLDAFTWHATKGLLDPMAIYPACGPLAIAGNRWPSYGFDEYFMTLAAYPRLAQQGMLTFVPTFSKSQLLTLDIEYVTWGNPNSELVYFPIGSCCGVQREVKPEETTEADEDRPEVIEFPSPTLSPEEEQEPVEAKVALLFLTTEELAHPGIWQEYVEESEGVGVFAHRPDEEELEKDSWLLRHQIDERADTAWSNISLVRATLALLRAACEADDFTHFMLLSDTCVPVRPYGELAHSLTLDSRSRMSVKPWTEVRKWEILRAQRLENIAGIRKEIAHFQEPWMLLNRSDAEFILSHDRTDAFEHVRAPEEAYFATIMAAAGRPPLQSLANRRVTWTNRNEADSNPLTYEKVSGQVAAQIAESGCFFARKFPVGSDIGRWGLHRREKMAAHTA
ncbi:beta-1,6-N-acetylglucosaminyltransferase [Haloferula sargassicola]|uniref:Uncharacterized protein n=1 Tax=Haloferula sargassicola TaxID=490096 RepID=A0ABP9USY8_9BACT